MLTFKNKTINQPSNHVVKNSEVLKSDIDLIYRLAWAMSLNMPKKPATNSNSLISNVLMWIDQMKNQKIVNQVKEQLMAFICRAINRQNGIS